MGADRLLTDRERELAEAVNEIAGAVDASAKDGCWAEELTPPDSEDDVLSSSLYTRPGSTYPEAGFTYWRGDVAYRVVLTRLDS